MLGRPPNAVFLGLHARIILSATIYLEHTTLDLQILLNSSTALLT